MNNLNNLNNLNIEIKAKCDYPDKIRKILHDSKADFKGTDHQIDTYFNINNGKLKLREGNIENFLVFYQRDNQAEPKQSLFDLYKTESGSALKQILLKSVGELVVVDKKREIYFINNIKFHIDQVKNLGNFIEIEANDNKEQFSKNELVAQCYKYIKLFDIEEKDFVACSYSDLLLDI